MYLDGFARVCLYWPAKVDLGIARSSRSKKARL